MKIITMNKNKKGGRTLTYVLIVLFVLIIAWGIYIYFENNRIDVAHYDVSVKNLPGSFEGFKIAQISDFHNTMLGKDNSMITDVLEAEAPDIIVITGDFTDSRNTRKDIVLSFAKKLTEIAPVYYVTGNHERRIPHIVSEIESKMKKMGVHVLRKKAEYIEKNGEIIQIIGVDDPLYYIKRDSPENDATAKGDEIAADIKALADDSCPSLLLAHRPLFFKKYARSGVDVVFSGHEHGGQFRLPFIGGVASHDEGLFPKYSEGVHKIGDCTMVVSRGLGQSIFPFRVNNSPELVFSSLHSVV